MSKEVTSNNSMGFLGWLTILFIGLKLTDIIDWSWWWVLSPILIPVAILLIIFVLAGILMGFISVLKYFSKKS